MPSALTKIVREHRRFWLAGLILCLCLLVFYVYWKLDVAPAQSKSRSMVLNDEPQAESAALADGETLSQSFTHGGAFHGIGLVPLFSGPAPAGSIAARLYDGDGRLLGESTGNSAETLSGSFAVLVFPETLSSPDGRYTLEINLRLAEGASLAFAKSAAAPEGWRLNERGSPAGGALCLMLATDPIGSFLAGYYWLFAVLGSALCAGLYLLASGQKFPLHRLAAAGALGLGLLFCLVLPPYAAPDEQFHINQTFSMSAFLTGDAAYDLPWGTAVRRAGDQNALIEDEITTVFSYREVARNLAAGGISDGTPVTYEAEGVDGYRLLHWPAALAVTLCRFLGLGFAATLYAGRLVNLLLFAFFAAAAVKLAPCAKGLFAGVMLLPISLHLAASFNRDGLVIALYAFYTALVLHYALEKPRLGGRDLLLLAALAALAGPAKVVYAPVLLLCLFIPAEKLCFRGRQLPRRLALLVKCVLPLIGCWSFISLAFGTIQMLIYTQITEPAQTAAIVAAGGEAPAYTPPPPNAQVFGIWSFFREPSRVFWMIVRTMATGGMGYLRAMLGASLGYNNLELSWGFVMVFAALLAMAALPEPHSLRPGRAFRLSGALIALGVCGLIVLACLFWTPTNYETIYGIQGRYFLPVLPLALCCLAPARAPLQKLRDVSRPLAAAFACTGVFALLNAFLLVLER